MKHAHTGLTALAVDPYQPSYATREEKLLPESGLEARASRKS